MKSNRTASDTVAMAKQTSTQTYSVLMDCYVGHSPWSGNEPAKPLQPIPQCGLFVAKVPCIIEYGGTLTTPTR